MSVFLKYKKESKSAFGGKFQLRQYFGDVDVGDGCLDSQTNEIVTIIKLPISLSP